MEYVCQQRVRGEVSDVPRLGGRGLRLLVPALLGLFFLTTCVSTISAQDLGELARQERARKQAEPPHEVHIYTNDDLARPKILIPEGDAKIRDEAPKPEPAAASSASEEVKKTAPLEDTAKIGNDGEAPKPEKLVAPLAQAAQPDSPPVPLGDIARQYREQKLAREKQAQIEAAPSRSTHIYSNEDLGLPTILTPVDQEVFEAAQKKLPPPDAYKTPEIEAVEQGHFSPSLGDIARLYRRQVPTPQITQPNRFPLLLGMTAFAEPAITRSVIRPPPRPRRVVRRVSSKFRLRRTALRLTRTENLADRTITVKPGDTLWSLARQYLGQGRQWRQLQRANSWIRDPQHLRIGVQIRI